MEDRSYDIDKMINTLIDLAKDEVEKARQRSYFGKDVIEPVAMIIELANNKLGTGGYTRVEHPGYDGYRRTNYEYDDGYEEGTGTMRGTRRGYGRNG